MSTQIPVGKKGIHAPWIFMMVVLAGMLNAGGLLRYGQTLSHFTGNLTQMGMAIFEGELKTLLFLMGVLCCFFVGATLSGLAFPKHTACQWKRCGRVLLGCGGLLLLAEVLQLPRFVQAASLAFVLGAHNGLAIRYRGVLTRTTHMTGHLTDCGAAFGRMLLGGTEKSHDRHLFLFHLACMLGFLFGVVVALLVNAWLPTIHGFSVISATALLYVLMGAGTWAAGERGVRCA